MDSTLEQIQDIINQEFHDINQKIKGTFFLEILKLKIIDRINKDLDKKNFQNLDNKETLFEYEDNLRSINVNLSAFKLPKSKINLKPSSHLLIICLNQKVDLRIEDKFSKKHINFNLIPVTGITLLNETQYNVIYSKNSTTLEINYIDKIDVEN